MTVDALDLPHAPHVPEGPKGLPIVGCAPQVKRDPLGFFLNLAGTHDGLATLRVGLETVYVLNSPEAFEHVFVTNWRNYRKSDFYEKLRPTFGRGIVTSEGDFWRKQRQLMNPAFHRESLQRIADIMRARTNETIGTWRARPADTRFNIATEITDLSIRIVLEALFGSDIESRTETVAEAVDTLLEVCERRVWAVPDLHDKPISPLYWKQRAARAAFDEIIFDIVARRRASDTAKADLLGMLLDARDEASGEGMSDDQLRDELSTLIVTGHESTANATVWTLYTLTQRPDILARVREELAAVCGGKLPTDAALREQTYLRQVIEEVMRIYPPAWTVSRTALEDDTILGYDVPAGANIMVSPYVMHRNPRFWPDPERLDPDRFAPGVREARPKFAYIPFGGGPRNCIGSNFAMMEMQIILSGLVQNFDMEVAQNEPVEREAIISVRPRNGIAFRAAPRKAA